MDCKEIQPVHPKGDQSWVFLEGMMLKLKLRYFGHLMGRVDSLENTLTPRSKTSLGFTPSARETVTQKQTAGSSHKGRGGQSAPSRTERVFPLCFAFQKQPPEFCQGKSSPITHACAPRLGLDKQGWKKHSHFESCLNQDWWR